MCVSQKRSRRELQLHGGTSAPTWLEVDTVSYSLPPPDRRHGIAELLALVRGIRLVAYDRSLAPDDAMRRIRDRFGEYDGRFDD
jgi:hypothetical protein